MQNLKKYSSSKIALVLQIKVRWVNDLTFNPEERLKLDVAWSYFRFQLDLLELGQNSYPVKSFKWGQPCSTIDIELG